MAAADGYNDSHRLLLQSIMSHGIMDSTEMTEVFKNCHKVAGIPMPEDVIVAVASHIQSINKKIKPLQLEIKKAVSEIDGQSYIVLVNRMNNQYSRNSGVFSVNQFELLKLIIAKIVASEQRCIHSIDCLNAADELEKKMTKKEAQEFLVKLAADKWLLNENGLIYLHTRAICELEPYLSDQFDMDVCPSCSRIVMLPAEQTCHECGKKTHKHCMAKCFTRLSAKRPHCLYDNCRAEWPYELNVTSVQQSQLIQTPTGSSQKTITPKITLRSNTPRKRSRPIVESDDEN